MTRTARFMNSDHDDLVVAGTGELRTFRGYIRFVRLGTNSSHADVNTDAINAVTSSSNS